MAELFTRYSISQIILFILVLSVSLKKLVEFVDWLKSRAKKAVHDAERPEQTRRIAEQHQRELQGIREQLNSLKNSINLLLQSDKDDIKDSITKDHHYFCYKLGCIDDYSLDCIERRYSHYKDEGGNSFVQLLMEEIRALPKQLDKEKISKT